MTKQNKGRKLFATTATAALVASAIVPVASAAELNDYDSVATWAKEAVKSLVDSGAVQGDENGNFNPTKTLTRAQAAQILSKVLDLKAEGTEDFADVKAGDWFYDAVVATSPEIFNGDQNSNFNPKANLTRQEAAKVLVSAFGLTGSKELSFSDSSKASAWAVDYLETAVATGVINGKGSLLAPKDSITNQEFATMVKRAVDAAVPAVTGVSATNSTTLTITGNKLGTYTAADITVADNTVKSYVVSADGKTATVTLGSQLVPDVTTKVTVKEKAFDVTYTIAAAGVSVVEATYDDDIANQFVAIKVDGKAVTAQELINAGYSLKFEAYETKAALSTGDKSTALFKSATTGELNTDLATAFTIPTAGLPLYVKATLTKGSDVYTSDLTKVTIKNLDLGADSVSKALLENYGTDGDDGTWANDFYQNSSTLVTGETAKFVELTVKAGSEEEKVTSGYSVSSSDVSVVSVTGGVLKAEGPGTATITVTYGNATYTKQITVSNTARKATKVVADKTSLTLTQAATTSTSVYLYDQYGDPMAITASNVVLEESDATKADASLGTSSDEYGDATLTFTGQSAGTGTNTVTFRDAANAKIGTTAVKATVTDNDTLAKYGLAVDDSISDADLTALTAAHSAITSKDLVSTDATLDAQADKYIKINLSGLNSAGVKVSDQQIDGTATDYTVSVSQSNAGVLAEIGGTGVYALAEDGYVVLEAGTATGTATITVKNAANNNIVATYKVTVESVGYNVTGATLKTVAAPTYATTLDYTDFLSYTAAENDPKVSGITLSKASAQPIRLDLTTEELYIDKNADGIHDTTDVVVGTVAMSTVGTFANSLSDAIVGIDVVSGDNGTVLFKVVDNNGAVVATKSVKVEF